MHSEMEHKETNAELHPDYKKKSARRLKRVVKSIQWSYRRPVRDAKQRFRKAIALIFKQLNSFAERAYVVTTKPVCKIKSLIKELSNIQGLKAKLHRIGHIATYQVQSGRVTLKKALNCALPVATIVTLIVVVQHFAGQTYALAVNYQGDIIAYINNETEFNEAVAIINDQLIYVDNSQQFEIDYEFSLTTVSDENEIIDSAKLADLLIDESQTEISKAEGLYVNGEFYGAIENYSALEATLDNILEEYQDYTGTVDAEFEDDVELKDGLFLNENVVEEEYLLSLITSNNEGEQLYTVVEGDSLSQIADKTNLTVTLLKALNPAVSEEALATGETITLNSSDPFLSVSGYKEIEYEETVEFETVVNEDPTTYENESTVAQEGTDGTQKVNATVKLVNGEEASREVTHTEIIVHPISKVVIQGSKPLPEGATVVSASSSDNLLEGISFIRPLQGAGTVSRGLTSTHFGIDWAAPSGTPIYASASGTVTRASWYSDYGNCVMINHGNGVVTLYGHLSGYDTTEGASVAKGQLIGYVGTTGRSTGNHLHFEIRYNGTKLDPFDYVSR